jgi:hypothetical protein
MTPSEIRVELLGQHAALRLMIQETCQVAERTGRGELLHEELRTLAVRLADGLRAHNRREEELLRRIIVTIDAWGPVRDAILSEQHVKEHNDLEAALVLAGTESSDAAAAAGSLVARLNHVLDHMAREEKAVLAADVLRDDTIVIDYFGA